MNSETEGQERRRQDEVNESNAIYDSESQLNKIAGTEHAMFSAEVDNLVQNSENGVAELGMNTKEGSHIIIDGGIDIHQSNFDVSEKEKEVQKEDAEMSMDCHLGKETKLISSSEGKIEDVPNSNYETGVKKQNMVVENIQNDNNSTHSNKDDNRVQDELSTESEELSQIANHEANGKVQGCKQSGNDFYDETVVDQELKAGAQHVEVSDMKEAVKSDGRYMEGVQRTGNFALTVNGNEGKMNHEGGDEVRKENETEKPSEQDKSNCEKTAEREWLDMLGNGLLKKKIITPGKGPETRPKPGNEVRMIVNGVLKDGTELKEEVLVFIHDDRELIQAFELAVALMEEGEKSILYTDSKYAYGPFGCESLKIPKNCNITYTLEIVSITEGPDKGTMSDEERIKIGDKKRLIGNSLYSRGDYGSAIDCYKRALTYLDGSANKDVINMKVKCQNNLSAAQLKVNAFQAALLSCNSVLTLHSNNIKAMFRKSKCLEALGKKNEALKCLKEASMIDPSNKMVYNELMRLDKYMKKSLQNESDMYKRMIGGLKKEDDAKSQEEETNFSFKLMIGTLVVAGLGIFTGIIWNRHYRY